MAELYAYLNFTPYCLSPMESTPHPLICAWGNTLLMADHDAASKSTTQLTDIFILTFSFTMNL